MLGLLCCHLNALCRQVSDQSPINATHYAKLYPQNGERIVTIDSVTSIHPMYRPNYRLSTVDMVVQRRDGPCWLRELDDDDDDRHD